MATIPTPGSELRHVRKTITFDGTAGNGQLSSNITVFTVTGRVLLEVITAYVSSSLVSTAGPATTALDPVNAVSSKAKLFDQNYVEDLTSGKWVNGSIMSALAEFAIPIDSNNTLHPVAIAGDYIITVSDYGSGADITGGTIVIDAYYRPLTDDGALAGDDIDEDLKTNIWSKALSDIASVPAMTASALSGLNWLFALARNKRTQTATTETVYKDDGSTSLATSTKSDDGTTYTRGEYS